MTGVYYPTLPPLVDLPLDASDKTFHQYLTISCDRDGVPVPNTVWTRHDINPSIVEWAKQNISPEFHAIGLNCCGTDSGGVGIPHTDRTRNWTLMWVIDPGGTDVKTVFWQERNHPVKREPGYYPPSYNDLQELESHVFEPNCWVLIDGNIIHSVENLQHIRKSVQISFWEDTDFVRKWTN